MAISELFNVTGLMTGLALISWGKLNISLLYNTNLDFILNLKHIQRGKEQILKLICNTFITNVQFHRLVLNILYIEVIHLHQSHSVSK